MVPELLHFRKWGSPVTYHLHGSAKPNARARDGYFIGYNGKHIYRVWDPETDTILTTSDVDFHEHFHDGSVQGGDPTTATPGDGENVSTARLGRASHMVNPSSVPVAANADITN